MKILWNNFWFADTSVQNLGYQRIYIGLALIPLHVSQFFSLLQPQWFGRPYTLLEPIWYFKLLNIDTAYPWLSVLVLFLLLFFTLTTVIGYKTRTSIIIMLVAIFYLKGIRDSAAGDVHHRYLMWVHVLIPLLLSQSHRVLSFDNFLKRENYTGIPSWQAAWPIRFAQCYVALFYFIGAISKLRVSGSNWLDASAIQVPIFNRAGASGMESLQLGQWFASHPDLCAAALLLTFAFEFSFPLLLITSSNKIKAAFLGFFLIFHIANGVLLWVNFIFTPLLFPLFFDLKFLKEFLESKLFKARLLSPKPIVFYDGVCGLCNRFIELLYRTDRYKVLAYASLQGQAAKEKLSSDLVENMETIVLELDGKQYHKSDAVLRILSAVGGFWRLTVIFFMVPAFIRDAIYGLVAENRYKIFGKFETCPLPPRDFKEQFLD